MKKNETELHWKRKNGHCIFGGVPVARSGQEFGLLYRLNLLKKLKLGRMILSIGCGTSIELKSLKKNDVSTVGLDAERTFLLEGKAKGNADDFIHAIGENAPLRDDSVDLVLLFEALEHVIKPELVLNEIHRILKPTGTLFLTVPNKLYLFETHGIQIHETQINNLLGIGIPLFSLAPGFLRRRFERARVYSETEILALLRKHGFEPFTLEYLMPPLDILRQEQLTSAIRHVFLSFGKISVTRKFGANIMVMSRKGHDLEKYKGQQRNILDDV